MYSDRREPLGGGGGMKPRVKSARSSESSVSKFGSSYTRCEALRALEDLRPFRTRGTSVTSRSSSSNCDALRVFEATRPVGTGGAFAFSPWALSSSSSSMLMIRDVSGTVVDFALRDLRNFCRTESRNALGQFLRLLSFSAWSMAGDLAIS